MFFHKGTAATSRVATGFAIFMLSIEVISVNRRFPGGSPIRGLSLVPTFAFYEQGCKIWLAAYPSHGYASLARPYLPDYMGRSLTSAVTTSRDHELNPSDSYSHLPYMWRVRALHKLSSGACWNSCRPRPKPV